jgi:hypothetical protein
MTNEERALVVEDDQHADQLSHFTVGIPIQLLVKGNRRAISSVSVGCLPGRCIIVKRPAIAGYGAPIDLAIGYEVIVRYSVGDDLFGFRSSVIGATTEPMKLLFLDYPRFVARCDLRAAKRIRACIPAQLTLTRYAFADVIPSSVCHGEVQDISTSGCCFSMDYERGDSNAFKMEDKVLLRIRLREDKNEIPVTGEIRRIEHNREGISLGIKFWKSDSKEIRDFVAAIKECGA